MTEKISIHTKLSHLPTIGETGGGGVGKQKELIKSTVYERKTCLVFSSWYDYWKNFLVRQQYFCVGFIAITNKQSNNQISYHHF